MQRFSPVLQNGFKLYITNRLKSCFKKRSLFVCFSLHSLKEGNTFSMAICLRCLGTRSSSDNLNTRSFRLIHTKAIIFKRFDTNRIENYFCIAFGIADFVTVYIYRTVPCISIHPTHQTWNWNGLSRDFMSWIDTKEHNNAEMELKSVQFAKLFTNKDIKVVIA